MSSFSLSRYSRAVRLQKEARRKLPVKARLSGLTISGGGKNPPLMEVSLYTYVESSPYIIGALTCLKLDIEQ